MKIDFILTAPEALPPEAIEHLKNAIHRQGKDRDDIAEVFEKVSNGDGQIYVIMTDKVIGSICLEIFPEIMNIYLLGGENIREWRDDLVSFLISLMRIHGIKHICVIGRSGWGSVFKELKPIGTFYAFEDKGGG